MTPFREPFLLKHSRNSPTSSVQLDLGHGFAARYFETWFPPCFSKFGGLSQFLFEEVLGKAPVKMMVVGFLTKSCGQVRSSHLLRCLSERNKLTRLISEVEWISLLALPANHSNWWRCLQNGKKSDQKKSAENSIITVFTILETPDMTIFRFPAKTEAIHTTLINSLIRRNWNQILQSCFGCWSNSGCRFDLQRETLETNPYTSTDFGFVLLRFWGGQIYNLDILGTKILFEQRRRYSTSKAPSAHSHQSHWGHNWSDDVVIACTAWVSKCRGH